MKKIILAMSVVFALSAVAFADDAANSAGATDTATKTEKTTTTKAKKHSHKMMKKDKAAAGKTDAAPAADAGATK